MKQSWLIVSNISKNTPDWDKTKTVYATGAKARKLASQYQADLNNGLTMKGCVEIGKDYIGVSAIPWSQAREYVPAHIRKAINEAKEYEGGIYKGKV